MVHKLSADSTNVSVVPVEEMDDSPFPTLQEAAEMAKNKTTLAVHRVSLYNNAQKLPDNPQDSEKETSREVEMCTISEEPQNSILKPVGPYFMSDSGIVLQGFSNNYITIIFKSFIESLDVICICR